MSVFSSPPITLQPPNQPPVGNVIPVNAAQPGVASVLDKASMMPVVRARFRAPNGRVREGNVLIDSGAGTTVIRKQFAKDLGLNGREQIDLAVVGGEKLKQPHSRRVNFWISVLEGDRELKIEAHEIDKTIVNVPEVDRKWLSSFPHLKDFEFHHISGPIDLILGVHYTHLYTRKKRYGKEKNFNQWQRKERQSVVQFTWRERSTWKSFMSLRHWVCMQSIVHVRNRPFHLTVSELWNLWNSRVSLKTTVM